MPLSTLEAALNLRHATDVVKPKAKVVVKKAKKVIVVKKVAKKAAVIKTTVIMKPEHLQKKVDLCKAKPAHPTCKASKPKPKGKSID